LCRGGMGRAQSWCRCGMGRAQSLCRCGMGRAQSWCRGGMGRAQSWCRCGMGLGRLLRFQRAKYWYQKSAEQGSSESKARTRIIPYTRACARACLHTPRTHTYSHTHAHAYTRRHARARTLPPPSLRILPHRLPPALVRTCRCDWRSPTGTACAHWYGMRGPHLRRDCTH
jgi:hypothetical protein